MTFDLERARGLRDFLQDDCAEVGDVWGEMIAEIERLQASLIDLHAEYINTLEKNPGCSAWDLDEQSIEDQRRLRRNAAHAISIVEPPIYLQADQQATLTKSLKKEIRRLKHESKVEQEFTNSYISHLHEAEARIKELEADNQNLVTMNKALMKNDRILRDNNGKYRKRSQKAELLNKSLKSKIGPDAKPRSWQITDERKATLSASLKVLERLKKNNTDTDHSYLDRGITVLRDMLREAE